jgi:hypothetical protein
MVCTQAGQLQHSSDVEKVARLASPQCRAVLMVQWYTLAAVVTYYNDSLTLLSKAIVLLASAPM